MSTLSENTMDATRTRSEILFLYEATYCIPNGDPFTGEQRYDEETKRILVSDVRIKRYVRDYLYNSNPNSVYVAKSSGSDIPVDDAATLTASPIAGSLTVATPKRANRNAPSGATLRYGTLFPTDGDAVENLKTLLDVQLFGAVLTKQGASVNLTGPVQFAILNPSLNEVSLRMHQNTSVFPSSADKSRGAIGTTSVVPYALMQIHGWISPASAKHTGLNNQTIGKMFEGMWNGVANANTRTKANQDPVLLLHIVYVDEASKAFGIGNVLSIKPCVSASHEQIRTRDDYNIDFGRLESLGMTRGVEANSSEGNQSKLNSDAKEFQLPRCIREIRYYTEDNTIAEALERLKCKHVLSRRSSPADLAIDKNKE